MKEDPKKRKAKNDEVLRKLKEGESLSLNAVRDSWFPPRPKTKKDKEAMAKLYNKEKKEDATNSDEDKPSDT